MNISTRKPKVVLTPSVPQTLMTTPCGRQCCHHDKSQFSRKWSPPHLFITFPAVVIFSMVLCPMWLYRHIVSVASYTSWESYIDFCFHHYRADHGDVIIFRVIGLLFGEFPGDRRIHRTKASAIIIIIMPNCFRQLIIKMLETEVYSVECVS